MSVKARPALAIATVVMLGLAGASQAFAAGTTYFRTVHHSTTLGTHDSAGGGEATAKARCPAGQSPAALGFAISLNHRAQVLSATRAKRSAGIRAINWDVSRTRTVTSYAYCQKTSRLHVRTASKTFSFSTDVQSVTARCPRGTRLLYGGFKVGLEGTLSGLSRVGDRGWRVQALPFSTTPVTAIAYCTKHAPRTTSRSRTFTVPAGGSVTKTVSCQRGQHAVGGGFEGEVTVSQAYTLPYVQKLDGTRGWTTRFSGDNSSFSGTGTAIVYCAVNR